MVSEKRYKTCLIKIAQENSCEYVLIIYMKKYDIAYHNYAEAVHALSAKIIYSNPASDIVHLVKTTVYNQDNNIQ